MEKKLEVEVEIVWYVEDNGILVGRPFGFNYLINQV